MRVVSDQFAKYLLCGALECVGSSDSEVDALPLDAWETSIVAQLLVHFELTPPTPETQEDPLSGEIHAWIQEFTDSIKREGKLEGEKWVLSRQLQSRFGALSPSNQPRMDRATLDEVEIWAARILTATAIEDVFGS